MTITLTMLGITITTISIAYHNISIKYQKEKSKREYLEKELAMSEQLLYSAQREVEKARDTVPRINAKLINIENIVANSQVTLNVQSGRIREIESSVKQLPNEMREIIREEEIGNFFANESE